MYLAVTFPAECDEIFFSIGAELASRRNVVDLESLA
jgi:hypothetical protein